MLGGLFTMLVSQTYFTDSTINPGSKEIMLTNISEFLSLLEHSILFNLGVFIIYSKISKYTKENYIGVYGFIISFIGYIILAAGIPYAITGHIGFSNASTAFLPSHPGSSYYDMFNIFYNQGIPHSIVLLLF